MYPALVLLAAAMVGLVQPELRILRTGQLRSVPVAKLERWVDKQARLAGAA